MTTSTYPKPPYENYEEVFHQYPVPIHSKNAFRAMERDGKIFKLITHKMKGVKYIYWHPDKNGIELWHKKNNVEAWVNTIHKLDERFIFAILRSLNTSYKTNHSRDEDDMKDDDEKEEEREDVHTTTQENALDVESNSDSEYDIVQVQEEQHVSSSGETVAPVSDASVQDLSERMDTSIDLQTTEAEIQWALDQLEQFKQRCSYKELFDVPDLTCTMPSYTFTPQLMTAMDTVLTSSHLPTCQTLIYDKHTCSLVWLRRDCSSYEIHTNHPNALDYAKRFVMNTVFQLIASGKVHPSHLIPITAHWVSAYHQIQYQHMMHKHKYQTNKNKNKKENKKTAYQNRKNRKRQCLHS